MRLLSLGLDQFRRFDQPVRLDGLQPGINVLCAPNEAGKSTLLAALRAVLFERHNRNTETIRSYQNRQSRTAPVVSLRFEHAGSTCRIEKRFLMKPSARLEQAGAMFDGDAAEERLATLLGVAAGPRGVQAARQAASIWEALLVDQGTSFAQAELGEQARTTLAACLEAELGAVGGGPAVARLLRLVTDSRAVLIDGNNKPKGRLKQALEALDQAQGTIAALEARRQRLEQAMQALLEARRNQARLHDPVAREQARAALAQARLDRDTLLGSRDREAAARAAVLVAEAECARLATLRQTRAALEQKSSDNQARAGDLVTDADAARQREQAALLALERARTARDAAVSAVETAQRASEAGERHRRHAVIRSRLEQAGAASERLALLSAQLASQPVDQAAITAIRQAVQDDRGHRAALTAQATRVGLSLEVPATLSYADGTGQTLPPGERVLELNVPATLRIEGVGAISIAPASSDGSRLMSEAAASTRRLRALLDRAGCADPTAAEHAHAARVATGQALDRARLALDQAQGKDDLATLRAQEAALRPDTSSSVPPDEAALATARDAAQRALEAAQSALAGPEQALEAARAALAASLPALHANQAELSRLTAELAQAEATLSRPALAEALVAAEAERARCLQTLDACLLAAPKGTLDMADAGIARRVQADANIQTELTRLTGEIARLEGHIEQEQGVGLDEAILAARRQQESAGSIAEDGRRDAAVLTTLRDTLLAADRDNRARTLAPLVGRIEPALRALFPDATLSLDDDFRVGTLSRAAGGDPEDFAILSHGTREQIAILSRLAFADMLLASGRPAFVVLDDALAFADPQRLDRMFDIVGEAARRMQILVLTCRPELADRLGGNRVRLEMGASA